MSVLVHFFLNSSFSPHSFLFSLLLPGYLSSSIELTTALMPTTPQFMFPCCSVLLTCHLPFEAVSLILNLPKTNVFILSASPTRSSTIFSLLPSTQFFSLETLQSFLKLGVTYCCLPMHLQSSNKYCCLLTSPRFSVSPAITSDYYLVTLPALLPLPPPPPHSILHTFSIQSDFLK